MKQRVVINIAASHGYTYRSKNTDFLIKHVEKYSPYTLTGLRNADLPWVGPEWHIMFVDRDSRCFQHVLKESVITRGFEACVAALCVPAFHLDNEGFTAWYRVAYALAGHYVLNEESQDV